MTKQHIWPEIPVLRNPEKYVKIGINHLPKVPVDGCEQPENGKPKLN